MDAIIIVRADEQRNPMRKINNIPFFYYVLNSLAENAVTQCYLCAADITSSTKDLLISIEKYFGSTFKKIKLYYYNDTVGLVENLPKSDAKIAILDANVILDFNFAQATAALKEETFIGVAVLTESYFAKEYASCCDCCIDSKSTIFKYEHDNSGKYHNAYTTGLYIMLRKKLTRWSIDDIIKCKLKELYGYLYKGLIVTSEADENVLSEQLLGDELRLLARKGLSNIINCQDDFSLSKFDIFYLLFPVIIIILSTVYYNNTFTAQERLLFISIWMSFVVVMYMLHFWFQKKLYMLKNQYRLKYLKHFTRLMR